MHGHFRRTWCDAADFLYPPTCALCRQSCDPAAAVSLALCDNCCAGVAPHLPDRCHRCSAPVGPYLETQQGCIHCRDDRFAFERVASLGVYEGPLRDAVLVAKAQSGDVLAGALAELLIDRERAFFEQVGVDVIVPVPHHWTDRLLRRHLPPATIGSRLARLLRAPYSHHILAKVRRTPPQTELSNTERRNNLRNAFRLIGRPELSGARVLLVDDVLTTGTTAHRAAALLKQAGATVNVAVLARSLGVHTAAARTPSMSASTLSPVAAAIP